MQQLLPDRQKAVDDIARRHNFSGEAVSSMLEAVAAGGGRMAQFNHPEFAGAGQWMSGGMVMVSDFSDNTLKGRIDSLCNELSRLVAQGPKWMSAPTPGGGGNADSSPWWPSEFGVPDSSGSQNDLRYACFGSDHRIAIDDNGQVTVYDTLDHRIGGVSQAQGERASLSFQSQHGRVEAEQLPVVSRGGRRSAPESAALPPERTEDAHAMPYEPPGSGRQHDVLATIEGLAALRAKGVLDDDEFSRKKAELLTRL